MGQSSLDSPIIKMKMFAVLALTAVAFAEPEPQVWESGFPLSTVYNSYSSPLLRAFTPYSAINGVYGAPVVHILGKRDADADPATVYTTGLPVATYGAVSHVASPLTTVNSVVPVTHSAVSGVVPVTHSAVNGVVSTYSAVNGVVAPVTHSLTSYNTPSHYTAVSNGVVGPKYIAKNHGVEHVVKRDAEPLVSSYYVAGVPSVVPATYSALPVTSYTAGHVVKGAYAPHAVAATPFGLTHSSNVGVCTNNMGVQVPC